MIFWKACEYDKVFSTLYESCDLDTQDAIDHRFGSLLEKGSTSREPVSKQLDGKIFELRAKDKRFLFYFGGNRTIVFVHAITKKRGDVPREAINLAKKRMAEILLSGGKLNALLH